MVFRVRKSPLTLRSTRRLTTSPTALPPPASSSSKARPIRRASPSAKGTTLVGLVERTFTAAVPCGVDGSEAYPNGAELTIAVRGDFYVEAAGEATVGQAVLCNPADGAVSYGTVGSENDTGWVVVTAAKDQGDIIIISRR